MSLLSRLDQTPPCVMRLLAARYSMAIGPDEISSRSGLSRSTVQRISAMKSWAGVRVEVVDRFSAGCGFGPGREKELQRRLRCLEKFGVASLKHLKTPKDAPLWRRGAAGNRKKFLVRIIA